MSSESLLSEGVALFNAGRYFEAHEVWEDLWRGTRGPLKQYYQGLIHAAVGLHHISRRNPTGARSQLKKSLEKLRSHQSLVPGIDGGDLISQLAQIAGALDSAETPDAVFERAQAVRIRGA